MLIDWEYIGSGDPLYELAYFAERGLVTPRLDGVLPGISQLTLFEIADELGVPRSEDDLTPEEFAAADEAFFTSTSICMLPMVSLDGRPLGAGGPGPLCNQILTAWGARVGVDIAEQARRFADR